MKPTVALLLLCLLQPGSYLAQQQPPQPKASIEGIVVRIGTGEPIAGARVTAAKGFAGQVVTTGGGLSLPPNLPLGAAVVSSSSSVPGSLLPGILGAPSGPYVTTDAQGRFTVKDLDPGTYRLTIAANGYARQEYGQRAFGTPGTPLNLGAGQSLKDVSIRLTPAGYVSGRVSDESGRPAVGIQVQLLRASYTVNGQKTFQSAGSSRTNDRGEYRLFWVTPGRYYLSAGTPPGGLRPAELGGGVDSPNSVSESYAMTYYPGAFDIKDAAVIDVQPNVELSAIDFSVPRQQLYRIRGRVIDSRTGQKPAAATMTIMSRTLTGGSFSTSSGTSYNAADGTFELRDVAPGSYVIGAQIQEGVQGVQPPVFNPVGPQRPSGSTTVVVSGSDLDGIALTIVAGVSIPGRLTVEGQDLSTVTGLDRIRIQLGSTGPFLSTGNQPLPQSQPVNPNGTFREDNAFPGEYRVSVNFLPPGFYVKDVRFEQTDALSMPLQFTGSVSGPLDVILSSKGAEIEGSVINDKQQAAAATTAVLIPDQRRDRIDLYKTAITDQNGHFTFRGIPPGDYRIFAWEAIEQFSYYDPDVVQRFESKGKPVHVSESDKVSANVQVIPADGQ